MMEEDYVDPAGGKPDVVAETRNTAHRQKYTKETVSIRGRRRRRGRRTGRWARRTSRFLSRRLSSRCEPSQQDASASFFSRNFGANILSSSSAVPPGVVTLPATGMPGYSGRRRIVEPRKSGSQCRRFCSLRTPRCPTT